MGKCVVCGEEANLYIDGRSICSRCDRQAQTVQRLRRMMDDQAKRGERTRGDSSHGWQIRRADRRAGFETSGKFATGPKKTPTNGPGATVG
jgi:hypothetical protein